MDWIEPMEPISRTDIVDGEEWIHQVKWDGIRGMCYIRGGEQRVFTKKGNERTPFYPELLELPQLLKGKDAVLDGELIVLDEAQKPSFYLSLTRERVRDLKQVEFYSRRFPARYIVFDILALDGTPVTNMTFSERRGLLLESLEPSPAIAITDNFMEGEALYELMKERGWEGIVSKRIGSVYHPGKFHKDWYKTKLSRKILAVVCGITIKEGLPNSLVLGIKREGSLQYIGKASLGISQEHFRIFKENTGTLKEDKNPFGIKHPDFKNVMWIKPLITCWVSFLEWTNDGGLRHPKVIGFSGAGPDDADGKEYVE